MTCLKIRYQAIFCMESMVGGMVVIIVLAVYTWTLYICIILTWTSVNDGSIVRQHQQPDGDVVQGCTVRFYLS